ncbi:MAG: pyruvate formate-lyase-activating protein [Gammaproteobacteria bacterium]|nr:pyruvate formate-lyase-activating protein [Gammaproteobacteria bacterium]
MLRVHSIETFGANEGPGIRLVVFLQGCPLQCLYCHNPDTQPCDPAMGRLYSNEQILELLEKERPYFIRKGGLTVSGGEPTLQTPGLLELFPLVRERGFHAAIDTNGVIYNPQVNALYDMTDLIILDVKHIDDTWHRKLTGGTNHGVLRNAEYREKSGKPMWLRYVLVPGWTDQLEFLEQWAQHFAGYTTVERVEILPYHTLGVHKYAALGRPYGLEGVAQPSRHRIEQARRIFAAHLPNVIVA